MSDPVDTKMNTRWVKAGFCMSLAVLTGYVLGALLHGGEPKHESIVMFLLMVLVTFEFDKWLKERDRLKREAMEKRGVSE